MPGGFLAAKYPANKLFGAAIGFSSFLNLLVPGAYVFNPVVLIIIRITQGLSEVSFLFLWFWQAFWKIEYKKFPVLKQVKNIF